MASLSSALRGMPVSSSVKPTTHAPYFFTSGKILSITACSPFTEFTTGTPQYARSPASNTSGCEESSCKGVVNTLCSVCTVSTISAFSSSPGSPTFTSKISAPASVCSRPWATI